MHMYQKNRTQSSVTYNAYINEFFTQKNKIIFVFGELLTFLKTKDFVKMSKTFLDMFFKIYKIFDSVQEKHFFLNF